MSASLVKKFRKYRNRRQEAKLPHLETIQGELLDGSSECSSPLGCDDTGVMQFMGIYQD